MQLNKASKEASHSATGFGKREDHGGKVRSSLPPLREPSRLRVNAVIPRMLLASSKCVSKKRGPRQLPKLILATLIIHLNAACSGSPSPASDTAVASVAATASASPGASKPVGWVLTRDGLGPIPFCVRLDSVARAFPSAVDTTFTAEDDESRWPAKIVHLPDSGVIEFETSWADTVRLSTIRATTRSVTTKHGYGPGTTLGTLIAAGESLSVELPEGVLAIGLEPDEIAFGVDSASEQQFYRQYAHPPRIEMINPAARIVVIAAGHSCRNK